MQQLVQKLSTCIEKCTVCSVKSAEQGMDCYIHCRACSDVMWTTYCIILYGGMDELCEKMLDACHTACTKCHEKCKDHDAQHCKECAAACKDVLDTIKQCKEQK